MQGTACPCGSQTHQSEHALLALYLQTVSAEVLVVNRSGLATRTDVLDSRQIRENIGHFSHVVKGNPRPRAQRRDEEG